MTTDAGSGFDDKAAGRDTGDGRLEEESRQFPAEDVDDEILEEARERKRSQQDLNDAF